MNEIQDTEQFLEPLAMRHDDLIEAVADFVVGTMSREELEAFVRDEVIHRYADMSMNDLLGTIVRLRK